MRLPTPDEPTSTIPSAWRRVRLGSVPVWLAAGFLGVAAGSALLADLLPLADPYALATDQRLQGPSARHPLGTDELGRDLLARVVYGGRASLRVGLVAVCLAFSIGVPLGILGGFVGGWVDRLIGAAIEVVLAFPGILLALVMIAILGPSQENVMLAVGIAQIPHYARQARASARAIREQDFVLAAKLAGTSRWRILIAHVLPNVFAPVLVVATMGLGGAILDAAGLSYLGLAGDTSRPEWGAMLNLSRDNFAIHPSIVLVPGLAITATVLSFNLLGDALRDRLDPRNARS